MPLSAIKANHVALSERVEEEVVRYIQENRLRCGDRLPNEKELELRLGVSRSTIREAMRSLRARGIVTIRQGSGTYVADSMGVSEDPLGLGFRYDRNKTLADLLDIRFMIEPSIAGACAARASDEQKEEIRRLCDEVAAMIRRGEAHEEKDVQLHCAIAKGVDNELVNVLFPDVLSGIQVYSPLLEDRLLEKTILRHQEIVDAIVSGDPRGAYYAMVQHLEDNRLAIIEYIASQNKNAKGSKQDEDWFYRIRYYGKAHGQKPPEGRL